MTLTLRAAARTDVGLRRDNNEDAMFAGHRLMAVADGMGGQVFGEVASRVAILTVSRLDNQPGSFGDFQRRSAGPGGAIDNQQVISDSGLEGLGGITERLNAYDRLDASCQSGSLPI